MESRRNYRKNDGRREATEQKTDPGWVDKQEYDKLKQDYDAREDLIRDLKQQLKETREDLRETCDKLEIEKNHKTKYRDEAYWKEKELHLMQFQFEEVFNHRGGGSIAGNYQNLQAKVTDQEKIINTLQRKEWNLTVKYEDECKRSECLEEKLKQLHRDFSRTEEELQKTKAGLKKPLEKHPVTEVEKDHTSYVNKIGSLETTVAVLTARSQGGRTQSYESLQKQVIKQENLICNLREEKGKLKAAYETERKRSKHFEERLKLNKDFSRNEGDDTSDANEICALEEALEKEKRTVADLTACMQGESNKLGSLVQSLQKKVAEQEKVISNLQKQKGKLKADHETEHKRSEHLEERLKNLNRDFSRTEGELQMALHKAKDLQKGLALDANKIRALEEALRKEKSTMADLTARVQKERESFNMILTQSMTKIQKETKERDLLKESVDKCCAELKGVEREKERLNMTVADQQRAMESSQQQVEELSKALATVEETNRGLVVENEALATLLQKKMKRKSRWKFWRST